MNGPVKRKIALESFSALSFEVRVRFQRRASRGVSLGRIPPPFAPGLQSLLLGNLWEPSLPPLRLIHLDEGQGLPGSSPQDHV